MIGRIAGFLLILIAVGCQSPPPQAPARLPKAIPDVSAKAPDPEMDAAIAQARASLDQFIGRLAHPKRNETFAVKGWVTLAGGDQRPAWIGDVAYRDGVFRGHVTTRLPEGAPAQYGEPYAFPRKDVIDWLILASGNSEGGFTEKVSLRREGQPQ